MNWLHIITVGLFIVAGVNVCIALVFLFMGDHYTAHATAYRTRTRHPHRLPFCSFCKRLREEEG